MALEVDRSCLKSPTHMQPKSFGRWRSPVPPGILRGTPLRSRLQPAASTGLEPHSSYEDRSGHRKTVTVVTTAQDLTHSSHYTMRKPLVSEQTSILKKPSVLQVSHQAVAPVQSQGEDVAPVATAAPHPVSPTLDTRPALTLEELRGESFCDDPDTSLSLSDFGRCLSSSAHIGPRAPRWSSIRRPRTQAPPYVPHMSPQQASYWACAIPHGPAPSPDRKSPHWDPEEDYQALLDYTYPLRPTSLLRDPPLQDSGIDLGHFCNTASLSGMRATQARMVLEGPSQTVDSRLSSSSLERLGQSLDSLLDSTGEPQVHRPTPTWRLLPSPWAPWDGEEEFHPLPRQLQEVHALSRQLKSVSVGVPSSGSRLGLEAELMSGMQKELNKEKIGMVSSLREQMESSTTNRESLTQHLKTFCSHLEELILWLYQLVEKMETLHAPSPHILSVRCCLEEYKSLQREVSSQQPLTAAVLRTGETLLKCMDSTSPVLRNTLVMVEKQSQILERHTERLFTSILSAMDSLTDPLVTGVCEDSCSSSQNQTLNESGFLE